MKKYHFIAVLPILLSSCSSSTLTYHDFLLREAKKEEEVTSKDTMTSDFDSLLSSLNRFSGTFTDSYYQDFDQKDKNSVISPLSTYFAFLIAAQISSGNTRKEILDTLNLKDDQNLVNDIRILYNASQKEKKEEDGVSLRQIVSNSIWFDKSVRFQEGILDKIGDDVYASSYQVDFQNDVKKANEVIQEYVKEMTHGMIDKDFHFSENSDVILMNTLYLKTLWNDFGKDLELSKDTYRFTNRDSSKKDIQLMTFPEQIGRAYHKADYSSFEVVSQGDISLRFILPKDDKDIGDIMTPSVLEEVSKATYSGIDDIEKKEYLTTCYFPSFIAQSDESITSIMERMGIHDLFNANCDVTPLTSEKMNFDKVRHIAKLDVDRKGIEGSAVTIISSDGGMMPDEYEKVHEDFILDRAFGYVIQDRYGIPLFTGITNVVS